MNPFPMLTNPIKSHAITIIVHSHRKTLTLLMHIYSFQDPVALDNFASSKKVIYFYCSVCSAKLMSKNKCIFTIFMATPRMTKSTCSTKQKIKQTKQN